MSNATRNRKWKENTIQHKKDSLVKQIDLSDKKPDKKPIITEENLFRPKEEEPKEENLIKEEKKVPINPKKHESKTSMKSRKGQRKLTKKEQDIIKLYSPVSKK